MLVVIAAAAMLAGTRGAAQDTPAHPAADPPSAETPKSLDLRAPDLTKLYTTGQIEALLAKAEPVDDKAVVVEGTREPAPHVTPDIWSGIATPFWALLHPMQAWRVFLPLPPDQTRGMETTPYSADTDGVPVERPYR